MTSKTTIRIYTKVTHDSIGHFCPGDKVYLLDGKLHREDGPAIELADGCKYWYVNGTAMSEDEFTTYVSNL